MYQAKKRIQFTTCYLYIFLCCFPKGHIQAINAVGWYALEKEKNATKAVQYFEQAYNRGSADAAHNLGHIYYSALYPEIGHDRVHHIFINYLWTIFLLRELYWIRSLFMYLRRCQRIKFTKWSHACSRLGTDRIANRNACQSRSFSACDILPSSFDGVITLAVSGTGTETGTGIRTMGDNRCYNSFIPHGTGAGIRKWWFSILRYVLYTLHIDRDRESLFFIVPIAFPAPVPVTVPCSVYKPSVLSLFRCSVKGSTLNHTTHSSMSLSQSRKQPVWLNHEDQGILLWTFDENYSCFASYMTCPIKYKFSVGLREAI